MARRALLFGSQCFGLTGVVHDVSTMASSLSDRQFDVMMCAGQDVTRDAIVEALRSFVGRTKPGDAVVIYYSGHGGRVAVPAWEGRRRRTRPGFVQFLVPADIEESTATDFRGLTDGEMSQFQWRLVDITRNVTTVLDCCHSGSMARDLSLVTKSKDTDFPPEVVAGLVKRLAGTEPRADSNPDAVRVVACAPEESAYEAPNPGGGRRGLLTHELLEALGEIGERPVPWSALISRIRQRVSAAAPLQRPEVEGPASRRPFTTDEVARSHRYPVAERGGRWVIDGGALFGLRIGDAVALSDVESGEDRGEATIEVVEGADAVLSITSVTGVVEATAQRLGVPRGRILVRAAGDDLRRMIDASPRLEAVDHDPEWRVDEGLLVLDRRGASVRTPGRIADAETAVDVLEVAAAATRLRRLDRGQLTDAVAVDLIRQGDREGLRRQGTRLRVGDRIQVRIQNLSHRPLFMWMFDIGVSLRIGFITQGDPSGALLAPVGTEGDTRTVWGARPVIVEWPTDVPTDGERDETFLVVIGDRRRDLSALATDDGRPRSASPLDGLLAEAAYGSREVAAEGAAGGFEYRLEFIDVVVVPPSAEPHQEAHDET
jgi:hypothetical protein